MDWEREREVVLLAITEEEGEQAGRFEVVGSFADVAAVDGAGAETDVVGDADEGEGGEGGEGLGGHGRLVQWSVGAFWAGD